MARLIHAEQLKEGELFCRWLHSRLIKNNKNVLGAELGPTGSGKSYRDLRKVEIWYNEYLKRPFPPENICFGVADLMKRITSGDLKRGDILIFEEAGANLGSLDFQNKVSKMFTYVLQSFRSMNIGIFFNLPYLSMLNKQARMLLHYSFESAGIDYEKKINKCRPFFHQVNQGTGKIYKKYPRGKVNGKARTFKRMNFSMPHNDLILIYEKKKAQYLTKLTENYVEDLKRLEYEAIAKSERTELTDKQKEVIDLIKEGLNQTQISKKLGKTPQAISDILKTIKKNGYKIEYEKNPKKSKENQDLGPFSESLNLNSKVVSLET